MPWNPVNRTECDVQGLLCYTCPTPTPTPNGNNCYWTTDDPEYVYVGTCWYWWTRHTQWCDGAITDFYDDWELDYCEAE